MKEMPANGQCWCHLNGKPFIEMLVAILNS